MPESTLVDAPSQLLRPMFLNVKRFNAKGDGITDDTLAIQSALNAAGGTATNPCTVFVPRGRYLLSTALHFNQEGIILQGEGMLGVDADATGTIFAATAGHDNTPMIVMNGDVISGWLRGTAIRNISFDLTGSTRFNQTANAPPPVIQILALSNCPEFREICIDGTVGTGIFIGVSPSGLRVSENLKFFNIFYYGGRNSGGATGQVPYASAIVVSGSDNIQIRASHLAYYFSNPTNPPVNNNLTDVAAVQLIPAQINSGGVNNLDNGFIMEDTVIGSWVIGIRMSSALLNGVWWGCNACRFTGLIIENFNKVLQINQENTGTSYGSNRSAGLIFDHCSIGGFRYGANDIICQASNLMGGFIRLAAMGQTGDLTLDSFCTGVHGEIGPNPSGFGSFFSAVDNGQNYIQYAKNGLVGSILTGQLRLAGLEDPSTTNAGSSTNEPLQCYGDTVKLWDLATFSNGRFPASSSDTGVPGEICVGHPAPGSNWYIYVCVGPNVWVRFGPGTYPF